MVRATSNLECVDFKRETSNRPWLNRLAYFPNLPGAWEVSLFQYTQMSRGRSTQLMSFCMLLQDEQLGLGVAICL